MSQIIRTLLVDDHTLFRESLRRVLEADKRFQVVGEASTLGEAMALIQSQSEFDLLLIDFQLNVRDPGSNGLIAMRAARSARPAAAIILVTAGAGNEDINEAVETLRASVFLKSERTSDLFIAIEHTLEGHVWISSGAQHLLLDQPKAIAMQTPEAAFTARELIVLRHITEGLSNKEIADQLSISESGVKALLQRLFEKTSVRTRSQLVRYVFECGLTLP